MREVGVRGGMTRVGSLSVMSGHHTSIDISHINIKWRISAFSSIESSIVFYICSHNACELHCLESVHVVLEIFDHFRIPRGDRYR